VADALASLQADPDLIAAWLSARSISRGLPQPVADAGGLRVDTGLPQETRRYVFARAAPGLRRLAETITEPRTFLKLCGSEDDLRAHLTPSWQVERSTYMMTCDRVAAPRPLAAGYAVELETTGPVTFVRIVSDAGSIAATGYAAEYAGVFAYDRIATRVEHQRKGLGAVVMTTLAQARRLPTATHVLGATEAGRALYEHLGWKVHSLYTTAVLPDET
jgi:GNAT superfamily N-acetyltransferase